MKTIRFGIVCLAIATGTRAFAQADESKSTLATEEPATASEPAADPDTVASAGAVPSETAGAAQASPDDPTAVDVAHDRALSALGVGEYGKHSESFVLWENAARGAYIKPIVMISSTVVGYFPHRDGSPDYASKVGTLVIARFGFEGAVTHWASFKLEFQRDLGYNISAGGPIGTGVWEGTASFQARENYVNLHKWGFTLVGGILIDPASVDFISSHVLDLFGMDPFVRDPLLYSGFNLAQGVMLRYQPPINRLNMPGRLVLGVEFTSGNPLTSSLAYGFGGNVSTTGTLYSAPLRSMTNGLPGTTIQLTVVAPSLVYEVDFAKGFGFGLRANAQFFHVNSDTTVSNDVTLNGSNFRGTARLRLPYVDLMGGFARRTNSQYELPDVTKRRGDNYESTVWNLGAEVNYKDFGVGASFYHVFLGSLNDQTNTVKYFSVAASYQLLPGYLATGLRYSSLGNDYSNSYSTPIDAKSVLATLRLTI